METMDIDAIMKMLPHRYPFLMIDRIVALEPGESATAIKCVSVNEPQFQGHFPGRAIMPGVLITEGFAQVAGIIAISANPDAAGKAVYLLGMDKLRFRKPVRPGDRLTYTVTTESRRRGIWTFDCRAEVDGQRVSNGTLMATMADR